MSDIAVFVHRAELELRPDDDPRAPGGAVTVALCGHWEHEAPCRWPHNNSDLRSTGRVSFRTVFIASLADEPEVRARIESALRSGTWAVLESGPGEPDRDEAAVARRIAASSG
jgi:hypothetical protein